MRERTDEQIEKQTYGGKAIKFFPMWFFTQDPNADNSHIITAKTHNCSCCMVSEILSAEGDFNQFWSLQHHTMIALTVKL